VRHWRILLGLLAVLILASWLLGPSGLHPTAATATDRPDETPVLAGDEISPAQLPPEAQETLTLVKQGGPFPYAKDGTTFGNREGLLPRQSRGYYREYTVPTPGIDHRGARRIVAGQSGDYWYTADHYRTFMRIRE